MRTLIAAALVVAALSHLGAQAAPQGRPADTITQGELRAHVFFLASDFLGGRRPDDAGFEIAAEYAAAQFRKGGVPPAFRDATGAPSYFQQVPMARITTAVDRLSLVTAAGEQPLDPDDLRLLSRGPSVQEVPMVFIGYGITEPDHGWDDLKDLDLRGKVAVMLPDAPMRDGRPVLPPEVHAAYQGVPGIGRRVPRLKQNRPEALLVVAAGGSVADAWPMLPDLVANPELRYHPGGGSGAVPTPPAAIAFVRDDLARALFAGQAYDPTEIPRKGLAGYTTFAFAGARLTLGIRISVETFTSVNVVGMVKGTDPSVADQVLTIGAHLDHVPPADGAIRNGADDNASGSAGVLEIAEAVAAKPFRRSVYFCLWTAEESDMAGSRHFLAAPPVAVGNIIVNLNLDMIGRSDAKAGAARTHYVIGSGLVTPELKSLIADTNAKTVKWPLDLELNESSMGGSDHINFHRLGIPTAFFFSGRHDDLHAPTDDAEKIDFEKAQRLAQLIYAVAAEVGGRDAPLRAVPGPQR
jgi:hypothetical protein